MKIPFEPELFGLKVNIHLILEYLAYFIAFRYYIYLRKKAGDQLSYKNRLSVILGAITGGLIGSRLIGFLENPLIDLNIEDAVYLLNVKSIMGGLFGGLLGVEVSKKIIGEKQSSGDLFTLPLILGIFIGRIGCFLSGTNEFTYGNETGFLMGMDLGDGRLRHPIALYELFFLIVLFVSLKKLRVYLQSESGLMFKVFMLAYFGFRFFVEFLKPNVFFVSGLSSIQWLCIVCWIYYFPTIKRMIRHAA